MEAFYESTRSELITKSGKDAVLEGICPDGGLFVWPELDQITLDLDGMMNMDYQQIAYLVFRTLLSGYTDDELKACIANAYTHTFAKEEITPVQTVGNVHVLELFHGPTSAFKDVALTILPQFMSKALQGKNQKALILTATSGDTGKAAMNGFMDVDNTGICVFYPDEKVSAIQYRQMASQKGKNVRVFAVQGNFDDAQTQVKKLFLDQELASELAKDDIVLSSANSINIGRLIPQIVYYFDSYRQLVKKGVIQCHDEVTFSVPTGNFGDVLAGYYAHLMGLPVKKFIVASNANNVLTDFLKTGVYDRNRPFVQTISPSMDILVSSNLERLLYYMSGKDKQKVAQWMKDLNDKGLYEIDEKTRNAIQEKFDAGFVDDEQTRQTIQAVYEQTGYVLDPHSAISYRLAQQEPGVVISLATASPYKFSSDVMNALGEKNLEEWESLHRLQDLNAQPVPAPLAALETSEILHDRHIEVDQMREEVAQASKDLFA